MSSEQFAIRLKRRQIVGSFQVAKATAELLRNIVSHGRWVNGKSLMEMIKDVGKKLVEAQALELAVGNIVRRVLYIIREEYAALTKKHGEDQTAPAPIGQSPSLQNLLDPSVNAGIVSPDMNLSKPQNLKHPVIEGINELIDELYNLNSVIAEQAIEHIHANEVVLTYGKSHTVEEFLKAAGKKRKFEVIVAETAPSLKGHEMAKALSDAGVPTTVITDSAIFAMMARVNKVIIGTHAVMANGGLVTHSGAHTIALAAEAHSVPVMVITGLYKLSPLYPFDQDTFNELLSPSSVLSYEEADSMDHLQVQVPAYDYVPPNLVSLFVTNFGGHSPSYVYRLLAEYYSPEDYQL